MRRLIFDIETNGLDDATTVHAIVIKDVESGEVGSFAEQPGYNGLVPAIGWLACAEELIGHNILAYDLPTLKRILGFVPSIGTKITDTLVCSRLIWTDLENEDFRRRERGSAFPPTLIGSHSLKAWGFRMGILKGLFNETTDWKSWSKEMQEYCEQDVQVTHALLKQIEGQNYSPTAIQLEHDFAHVIHLQEKHGFRFNEKEAGSLAATLLQRRQDLTIRLRETVPPKRIEMKTPEYWYVDSPFVRYKAPTKGALKDELKAAGQSTSGSSLALAKPGPNKFKLIPFNPGSRVQVGEFLKTQGWVPVKFTETGRAKVDETTLEGINSPAALLLKEYFIVHKLLGQLSEGDNAWLKLARNGRIHGQVNTNGAVTGRCAHYKPNITQVPAVMLGKDKNVLLGYEGKWGWECRSLFLPDEGQVLVGADASGLELRCLAHYMARYDNGAYAKVLLQGDVHSVNQAAAGIATRAEAKTFIYSYLYGAGNHKLGVNCGGVKPEEIASYRRSPLWGDELRIFKRKAEKQGIKFTEMDVALAVKGNAIRRSFETKTPALAQLKEAIAEVVRERGYLVSIDGRRGHVRSTHAALNTLLQMCGALLVKIATVILYKKCIARGWVFGKDFANVAHVQDEIQSSVRPDIAPEYGQMAVDSIREAGEQVNFRVPLAGEYKIGPTWAATH